MKMLLAGFCALASVGCGTASEFARQMEEPAPLLSQAGEVAGASEQDVIRATVLGMASPSDLLDIVCKPIDGGPAAAKRALSIFKVAVDAVAKSDEASYSGYLRCFKAYRTVEAANEETTKVGPGGASDKPALSVGEKDALVPI